MEEVIGSIPIRSTKYKLKDLQAKNSFLNSLKSFKICSFYATAEIAGLWASLITQVTIHRSKDLSCSMASPPAITVALVAANASLAVALIGGGTGTTPLYQLLDHVLTDPTTRTSFTLLYANVSRNGRTPAKGVQRARESTPINFARRAHA